jgi:hypothetical protein
LLAELGGRLAFRSLQRPIERIEASEATMLGNEGEREFSAGQEAARFFKLAAQNGGSWRLAGNGLEPPDEYRFWHSLCFLHYSLHTQTLACVLVDVTHCGGDVAVIGGCVQLLKGEYNRTGDAV